MGDAAEKWMFNNVKHGHPRESTLSLSWEVDGDPISDDFTPDEISAADLFDLWVKRLGKRGITGDVRIFWFVAGSGTFEAAPFMDHDEDFLTHFTWPESATDGRRLNWLSLPVVDKLWRPAQGDKGGFIQEFSGWKPSPFVPSVNLGLLSGRGRS